MLFYLIQDKSTKNTVIYYENVNKFALFVQNYPLKKLAIKGKRLKNI